MPSKFPEWKRADAMGTNASAIAAWPKVAPKVEIDPKATDLLRRIQYWIDAHEYLRIQTERWQSNDQNAMKEVYDNRQVVQLALESLRASFWVFEEAFAETKTKDGKAKKWDALEDKDKDDFGKMMRMVVLQRIEAYFRPNITKLTTDMEKKVERIHVDGKKKFPA
jgi:hypothetical protein